MRQIERRATLRTVTETGRGRYSGQYAFSGKLICGNCGAGFRRHNQRNGTSGKAHPVWVCIDHTDGTRLCTQSPIKESYLEGIWVETLNGIFDNTDFVLKTVESAVREATAEAGDDSGAGTELKCIDTEIEALQAQIYELNKLRGARKITAEEYNDGSRAAMARLDELFIKRDAITERQNSGALSETFKRMLADTLADSTARDKFEKDVFTRLVDTVRIKSKTDITFELKDGTSVKANITNDAAE